MYNISDTDLIILVAIIAVLVMILAGSKKRRLQKYKKVKIGMSERKMLSIMGKNCSMSYLENGITIYEWNIPAKTYKSSYGGVTHVGERSVIICVKNGHVHAIKSQNI